MKLYIKNTDNNNYSEIACNYASLNIYNADTEKVLYTTCRLTGSTSLDFDLYIDSNIRSARKLNLKKNDIFEVKTTTKDTFMNNGKDLYIPDAIIKIVSQEEKLALEANGCKDYKQVYAIEFIGCKAYKTTRHSEIVDFPEGTKIADYDPNGVVSDGYIKGKNTYNRFDYTNSKFEKIRAKGSGVMKKWLTYDQITTAEIVSDYYTRSEKDDSRVEREKIADLMTNACNVHISHYDVARMLKVLNISIK